MAQPLDDWKKAKRTKIPPDHSPDVRRLYEAAETGELIKVHYMGGSTPGGSRMICPKEVFQVDDYDSRIYVAAYCATRDEDRIFRLDKLQLEPSAFQYFDQTASQPAKILPAARKPASQRRSKPQQKPTSKKPPAWIWWVIGAVVLWWLLF